MNRVELIWRDIEKIRSNAPLVHNITNFVVMNSTANALLAVGASPIMAHAIEEVRELVKIASCLVINIGTLSEKWIESMIAAVHTAGEQGVPVVLDPVGAGASVLRTDTAKKLFHETKILIVRGNASEIRALRESGSQTKGVDSLHSSDSAVDTARDLINEKESVVCISGATDYIVSSRKIFKVLNGHPLMSRVTGMGCTATSIIGAFAAVNPSRDEAAFHASAVLGIAGEIAAEKSSGPGSFQVNLLDSLYGLKKSDIEQRLKVEE